MGYGGRRPTVSVEPPADSSLSGVGMLHYKSVEVAGGSLLAQHANHNSPYGPLC